MTVAETLAAFTKLEELAKLLPRVGDVLEVSSTSRRLLAGRDPGERPLCDDKDHRAAGFREPCEACRVRAEQEGWKPAAGLVLVRAAVVDAAADAELVLADVERRVVEHLRVCPYPSRMVTAVGRARRLAWDLLPWVEDVELVRRVADDVGSAVRSLRAAIDGEPMSRLPSACPHCGRRTLVVYHDQGVIRCERRSWQVCVCAAADCPCREGARHEWLRSRGTGLDGEWGMLARLLERGAG